MLLLRHFSSKPLTIAFLMGYHGTNTKILITLFLLLLSFRTGIAFDERMKKHFNEWDA